MVVGQSGKARVPDFGWARWQENGRTVISTREPQGTPSYMAPEQAKYPAEISVASDVYGLGATLYALLTGRPPFQAADPVETLRQVRDEDPIAPCRVNPAGDRDLEWICLKCLRKERHLRYADAEQLASELRCYLDGRPLLRTRPFGRRERWWRWCRRNPSLAWASGLAGTFLLLMVTILIVFVRYLVRTNAELQGKNDRLDRGQYDLQCQIAESFLNQGVAQCEQGNVSLGMHQLAYALQITPTEAKDLQRAIRMNLGC